MIPSKPKLEVTLEDEAVVNSVPWDNSREIPNANDQIKACNQCLVDMHHKGYLHHLRNSYLDGDNNYPYTVHKAYNILHRREVESPHPVNENDGV